MDQKRKAADDIRMTSILPVETIDLFQQEKKTFSRLLRSHLQQVSQQLGGLKTLVVGSANDGAKNLGATPGARRSA